MNWIIKYYRIEEKEGLFYIEKVKLFARTIEVSTYVKDKKGNPYFEYTAEAAEEFVIELNKTIVSVSG